MSLYVVITSFFYLFILLNAIILQLNDKIGENSLFTNALYVLISSYFININLYMMASLSLKRNFVKRTDSIVYDHRNKEQLSFSDQFSQVHNLV